MTSECLFKLHNNENDDHTSRSDTPLGAVHRSHAENDTVESWDVGDRDLQDSNNRDGVPAERISPQDTWMEGAVVCEASGQTDGDSAEIEHVECLGSLLSNGVALVPSPEDGKNNKGNQGEGSQHDTEKQVTTNQSLSNLSRWQVHDTVLSRLNGTDESKGNGTDQVGVQDLNGGQRLLLKTEGQTKENAHTLRVVDRSVNEKDLTEVIPDNTTLTNSFRIEQE